MKPHRSIGAAIAACVADGKRPNPWALHLCPRPAVRTACGRTLFMRYTASPAEWLAAEDRGDNRCRACVTAAARDDEATLRAETRAKETPT